ncbi:MAG: hypothetical protein J6Q89_04645 [Clostridia bacterium]|nr:hypothetical protein [Clostridia bacterium]
MRTRNYYIRHWGFVVIRRACPADEFFREVVPALRDFRGMCSYGLLGVEFRADGKVDSLLVCLRKDKPLRYDSLCRRFPKAYVTRIPKGESPSEVARKWRIKHSDESTGYVPPVVPFGAFKESIKLRDLSDVAGIDDICREREDEGFVEYFEGKFDRVFESLSEANK